MPVLDLWHDMLCSPLILHAISAVMLWPHDPSQRAEWLKTCQVEWLWEQAPPQIEQASYLARDAFPMREMRQRMEKPYFNGRMAGELLDCYIGDFEKEGAAKLDGLIIGIAELNLKRQKLCDNYKIKKSRLWEIWKEFKPVAHLWAAHGRFVEAGEQKLPCPLKYVEEFISLADFYLRAGLAARLAQSGAETLLKSDEVWTWPAGSIIPKLTPEFGERPRA